MVHVVHHQLAEVGMSYYQHQSGCAHNPHLSFQQFHYPVDPVTHLTNKRGFFDHTAKELHRSRITNKPLSILLLEIDFFDQLEETRSPTDTKHLLQQASHIIRNNSNNADLPAYLQQGQFGVVMPNTNKDAATWVGKHICQDAKRQSHLPSFTISGGVASTHECACSDPAVLYDYADKRLFIAKSTGANHISTDELVMMH